MRRKKSKLEETGEKVELFLNEKQAAAIHKLLDAGFHGLSMPDAVRRLVDESLLRHVENK